MLLNIYRYVSYHPIGRAKKKNLHMSLLYGSTKGCELNQKDRRYGIIEITICIDDSCTSGPNVSAPNCQLQDVEGYQKSCEYCTSGI